MAEEDITSILKPLRKIIITGNSLEPNKEGFVLTRLNKFIALERVKALWSMKKIKVHKETKREDESSTEQTSKNETKSTLSEEEIAYAKVAIEEWEDFASDIVKLLEDGKGQDILDSLIEASKLKEVCKIGIVFCLIIVIKKPKDLNIISKAYSAVPQICTTSSLLMLFIELCKVYATANNTNSGFGRGMKRAIKNWYLRWEPRLLALEVSRFRCAYTWSHKDVLKMAHINLKDLPTGTSIVLHFIFSGFDSTHKKFEADENAKDLIPLLEILHKGSNEIINSQVIVERGTNILDKFGSISLNDFPTQALNDIKVMSFLLEKGSPSLIIEALATTNLFKLINSNADLRILLRKQIEEASFSEDIDLIDTIIAYNFCRRISAEKYQLGGLLKLLMKEEPKESETKKWMKNAAPNPEKATKSRVSESRPEEINDVFNALTLLVSKGLKSVKKVEKIVFFIDMTPSIDGFISVSKNNPVSKEVRGTQAIAYLLIALTSPSCLASTLPHLIMHITNHYNENRPGSNSDYHSLQSALSYIARTYTNQCIDVDRDLKAAVNRESSTYVFCYFKLTKEIRTNIHDKFTKLKEKDPKLQLRLIVCVLDATCDIGVDDTSALSHPDLVFMFGFNKSSLPFIQAFSNRHV